MSSVTHPHTPIRTRVRSTRLAVLIVTVFVLSAAIVGLIVLVSGGSDSSSSTVAPASQVGGPNEALRGQSAATASGASQPGPTRTGGPDETARGNAAASASR
jgi:hypothetical protein